MRALKAQSAIQLNAALTVIMIPLYDTDKSPADDCNAPQKETRKDIKSDLFPASLGQHTLE